MTRLTLDELREFNVPTNGYVKLNIRKMAGEPTMAHLHFSDTPSEGYHPVSELKKFLGY